MQSSSNWGGEADAVRHCTWLCLMSKNIGIQDALEIAHQHEKHHPAQKGGIPDGYDSYDDWNKADGAMDNTNNQFGARLGTSCGLKDCCSACKNALTQGLLKVNKPGGYVFPQ
jgi:hypothetical protein